MHREEGSNFSRVTTFNLDEYVGLPPEHDQSYHYFMREHLFKHINVDSRHVTSRSGRSKDINAFCEWYEQRIAEAGGSIFRCLESAPNGHIAFNEPGSSLGSRTRVRPSPARPADNGRFFGIPRGP